MKKFVSFLLIATMLMSCGVGFATSTHLSDSVYLTDESIAPEPALSESDIAEIEEKDKTEGVEPLNVSPVGNDAFAGNNVSWTVLNGMLIVSGTGDGVIDNFVEGDAPWYGNKDGITFIYLSGIKTIGSYAFYGLDKVSSIYLTNDVKEINSSAFEECSSLISFNIPDGLTKIGYKAFKGCRKISKLHIPASIEVIEDYAFDDCYCLENVEIEENDRYLNEDGVIFDKEKTELKFYPPMREGKKYSVPTSVVTIKENAFKNASKLVEVVLNKKLTKIGDGAFSNCSSLVNFKVSKNVSEIGRDAFRGCSSLEKFTVESGNDYFKGVGGVLRSLTGELIRYPANMSNTSYSIPDTISVIKEGAFDSVRNLNEVEIKKNVETIESYAFDNAGSITKVKYEGSIQQWGLIDIGIFNEALTESEIEYGETVNSYTLLIGETYNLMDYLDDEQKEQIKDAEEINVNSSVPNVIAIDVDNTTITAASLGETLVTASAKIGAAIKKVSVLINVSENSETAGIELEFTVGDDSVDLKNMAEVEGFNSFWDKFVWVSTDPSVATVDRGVVTPVNAGETTILAKLQDDKKAISCRVVVKTEQIDYKQYFEFVDGIITKYKGGFDDGVVVIPEKIDDMTVTEIASRAFANTDVKKVVLNGGVKVIGRSAFSNARNLSEIILPEGLTTIEDYAFSGCNSLENITIPSTVSVYLSGTNWFSDCGNLKGVIFANGMERIGMWIYSTTVRNVTLPSTLKEIPSYTFYYCTNLKSVNIPDSVTSIGDCAFYRCSSLEKINLNKTQTIGNYAFAYNTALRSLDLGTALVSSAEAAFTENSSLTSVCIPATLKNVVRNMFMNCYDLSSVSFENGVERIERSAFKNCGITSLSLPASIVYIGSYAFDNNQIMQSVSLGNQIETIEAGAFRNCYQLTAFVIPNSVSYIGNGVFSGCNMLQEITIGSGISDISKSLFSGCNSIKKITLSNGIKSIGNSAFRSCSNIEEIVIPESVKSIGNYAFAYCKGLKEINIPSTVDMVCAYAFYQCSNLRKVTVGSREICSKAFAYCFTLESVVFDNTVRYVRDNAFYECKKLKNLVLNDGLITIGSYAFAYCYYLTNISIPGSVSAIEPFAFYSCRALSNVSFNNNGSLERIGDYAFNHCLGLESIYLPNSLETIGSYAFSDCCNLTNVNLGDGLTNIYSYAFYRCKNLKEISFPDSLRGIETYAFGYCYELENISNLTPNISVGYNAFFECKFMNVDALDMDATSYKALDQEIAGYIPLELNYKLKDSVYISNPKIMISLPESVSILAGSFKINGKVSSDFVEVDASYGTKLTIPVEGLSGTVSFMIKPETWKNITSTAQIIYNRFGMNKTYLIGTVNCSLPEITVSSVDVTSSNKVIVEGMTRVYSNVSLYVNDEFVKSVRSNSSGNYKTTVTLNDVEDNKEYTIKAVKDEFSATTVVKYESSTPNLESLKMYYGKSGRKPAIYNLTTSNRLNLTWGDYFTGKGRGYSYYFEVDLSNAQNVDKVYVVSVRNNEKEYLEAKWNGSCYVTEGYFKNDCEYIIGTLSVEYTKKLSPVEIKNPSDTVAYFDINSSELSPSINELFENVYSAEIIIGEELKEALGDRISLDVETNDIEVTQDVLDKLDEMPCSYNIAENGADYIIAVDNTMPDYFRIYLLNKTENRITVYNISFVKTDEDGFEDTMLIEDVMDAIEKVSKKYESLFGIDIEKEKLESDMAMVGVSISDEEVIKASFDELVVQRRVFLLSSLVLSASAVGEISPDTSVLYLLARIMDSKLERFRELKLANIYKLSSDMSIRWYIDPSGYVYEGVTGNRLEGVTATIYYKGEDGKPVQWIDENYGQCNPVQTDEVGKFKWDVSEGEWQIKFEKDGYKTYITEWMPVPPPQTEVNVELEPDITVASAPEVKITTDEIVISYKDYMDPNSVINSISIGGMTKDDYTVVYNQGSENLPEGFTNKDISDKEYAKIFTLAFKNKLLAGDSLDVSIGSANTHISGVLSAEYHQTLKTQEPDIKEVTLINATRESDNAIYLDYRNNTGRLIDVCKIIVAAYDENNCLVSMIPFEIENFDAYENAETLIVPVPDGCKTIKFYAWDANNKPLGRVETYGE